MNVEKKICAVVARTLLYIDTIINYVLYFNY